MRMQRLARRGVSTIVGAVIFLLIAIAVLVTMILIFNSAMSTVEKVTRLALTRASEASLANAISGWWILEGTNLVINITNNAPRTIEIDAVAIVLSNGSYIALYPGHTLGSTITVVKPDGTIAVASLSLPLYLGMGYTINITVPNIVNTQPKSVSIALSMSPIVISLSLKPYAPTRTIAAKPPPIYLATLSRYSSTGTVAILKRVSGATYTDIAGSITSLSVSAQSYNGTASDLEYVDSNTLNATSLEVPPTIRFVNTNARVYTNFTSNPFTQPTSSPLYLTSYTNSTYASWIWGSYGYIDGGLMFNTSLQLTVSGGIFTIGSGSVAAIGLAYNNYVSMPTNSNWSIATKIYVPSITSANLSLSGLAFYYYLELNVSEGVAFIENTTSYYDVVVKATYNTASVATTYELLIEKTTPQGASILQSSTVSLNPGWYILYAEYNPVNHGITAEIYYLNGTLITTLSTIDASAPQPNPLYAGIYSSHSLYAEAWFGSITVTSSPRSFFDDFIAGVGNVSTITVYNLPSNSLVKVINSTGGTVSQAPAVNGIALLNVITEPIISNGRIDVVNISSGTVLASQTFNLILGDSVYQYLPPRYEVEINMSTSISLYGVINDTSYWSLYVPLLFSFNVSAVNVTLYAYNVNQGAYTSVYSATNALSPVDQNVSLSTYYINTSSGVVKMILVVDSYQPFLVSIDSLNAILRALKIGSLAPLLIVGVGSTSYIDVYQVGITVSGPTIQYLYSINAHTLFNGSAALASDEERLYLMNSSGIYYAYVMPNANFTLLTSACRATGVGAQLTALNLSGITYLIALPGNGNNTLCVVNVSNDVVTTLNLGSAQGYNYSVSAYNSSCAWFVVNASGYPELIQVCGSSFTVTPLLNLTTVKNVGLAYCGSLNELVMLGEGGPSYVIDLLTKSLNRDGSLPFYPVGLGDRLGCYNGYAFFVRADETNELWVWKVSG